MQRQSKTVKELADMISARLGGVIVGVFADQARGWQPTVFAKPSNTGSLQLRAEEIALELRATFDLKT